jgi:drug/metabolite transporter (DMT)-like permease
VEGKVAFGGYTIALRPLSRDYGALPATAATTVAGSLPYLAFAGLVPVHKLASLPPMAWGELVFLGLGSTVAGMLLWNRAVLAAGSARVSPLLYLEPVVSVASAAALLGERVPAATVAGGLLVMAGVVVSGTGRPAGAVSPWSPGRCRKSRRGSGPGAAAAAPRPPSCTGRRGSAPR